MDLVLGYWIGVFIVSVFFLVKGADWLLYASERLGLAIGLPPFIIGVLMVSLGTSFPELIASFFAAAEGLTEFASANAVGSNLANILLVVGISALVAGRLTVTRDLIDVELPLLAMGTVLFLGVTWNGEIIFLEAALMVLVYVIYIFYTFFHYDEGEREASPEALPSRKERREQAGPGLAGEAKIDQRKVLLRDLIWFVLGALFLFLGSRYLVDSVVGLSEMELMKGLGISVGVITLLAVAIGTSLPELLVSIKAALRNKPEVALGNVFGSNAFNMMIVVGLPALFYGASLDEVTYSVGLPVLGVVTFLFVISGISRRIHMWEGAFYLVLYALFVLMLLGVS